MSDEAPEDFVDLVACLHQEVDILTELSGVTYDEAASRAITGRLGSQPVRCIGLDAMIRNKRATGRTKDLADAEALEEIRDRNGGGRARV